MQDSARGLDCAGALPLNLGAQRLSLRMAAHLEDAPMETWTLDPVILSHVQWAWVVSWHILLPAFTVGLASYIAVLEGFYLYTKNEIWFRVSGFWTRIFAACFGMGVVSGIIMPFQLGTNWSRFTDAAADVISPMMAYEGLMVSGMPRVQFLLYRAHSETQIRASERHITPARGEDRS